MWSKVQWQLFQDPFKLAKLCWPHVTFYREQRRIIRSVDQCDETFVPAGNMLGKDFVTGFILLYFFLTRTPCRVVTTSVDHSQLAGVLWGEVRRFIQESRVPLEVERGGPLIVNHLHLRKMVGGVPCGLSYAIGRVAAKGEGMLGHHIAETGDGVPRTMFIADEASGVDDISYERADTWARRKLIIGNPYPCANFFYRGVIGGPLKSKDGSKQYRNVIRIRADDSPNVRFAREELARGLTPSNRVLVPGVLPWADYCKRRETWNVVKQCVSLDAEFYEGAEERLFPTAWLVKATQSHYAGPSRFNRRARAIGVDPGEGGADTAMAAVDEHGLIELLARKTPDTSVIPGEAMAFAKKHGVEANYVVFDRGGGGKQHADALRAIGYPVRTVAFGAGVTLPIRSRRATVTEKRGHSEERYVYVNMRAQLFGEMRLVLERGWAVPGEYEELLRQMRPVPLRYDREGRLTMLPKHRRDPDSSELTLTDLLGCSPDELDAVALAVHGMLHAPVQGRAGAVLA